MSDKIIDDLVEMVELKEKRKVSDIKLLTEIENGFNVAIFFKDGNIIQGRIFIQTIDGDLIIRLQGDYL